MEERKYQAHPKDNLEEVVSKGLYLARAFHTRVAVVWRHIKYEFEPHMPFDDTLKLYRRHYFQVRSRRQYKVPRLFKEQA